MADEIWFKHLNVHHVLTVIDPAGNQPRSEISHSKHSSLRKQTAPSDECVLGSVWFITSSGTLKPHCPNQSICLKHHSAVVSSLSGLTGRYDSQHIPDLKTFGLISLFYFPHGCVFLISEPAIWRGLLCVFSHCEIKCLADEPNLSPWLAPMLLPGLIMNILHYESNMEHNPNTFDIGKNR